MLHTPSYNMGLAAGLARKAAGLPHLYMSEATEDSEYGKYLLDILERADSDGMFMPSSFLEGMFNAYNEEVRYKFILS